MLTIGNVARRVGIRHRLSGITRRRDFFLQQIAGRMGIGSTAMVLLKLLLFVRRAQSLGITLKEIKPLLNLASQGQQPCAHVKQLARQHLRDIDQKIRELQILRLRIRLRRKAAQPHRDEVCPIIDRD